MARLTAGRRGCCAAGCGGMLRAAAPAAVTPFGVRQYHAGWSTSAVETSFEATDKHSPDSDQ